MKKIILVLFSLLYLQANTPKNESFSLLVFFDTVFAYKESLRLTPDKLKEINAVKQTFQQKKEILSHRAFTLEKALQNLILEGKASKKHLENQFSLLQGVKKDLLFSKAEVLNTLRHTLGADHFKKVAELAQKPKKSSKKFKIDELVILPHPGKNMKLHGDALGITMDQKVAFKEIKRVYAPLFQNKMRAAFSIEKKVQRLVAKGKKKEDLKPYLDQISYLKRSAIDDRIDALNAIQKLLTPMQWKKINQMTYQ